MYSVLNEDPGKNTVTGSGFDRMEFPAHDRADVFARYREMEKKHAESERRYKRLFETAPLAVFFSDPDGRIQDCNRYFADILGFDNPGELLNLKIYDFFASPPEGRAFIQELIVNTGTAKYGKKMGEWKLRDAQGGIIPVLVSLELKTGASGQPEELRGHLEDISEYRELETHLANNQKLETMGYLSGTIAHDFNNVLSTIIGYCSLIQENNALDPELSSDVDRIFNTAQKASDLIRQLLSFSRGGGEENEPCIPVRETLNEIDYILRRLVRREIGLHFNLYPEELYISLNRSRFEQMVINLIRNAQDAIEGPGFIEVKSSLYRGGDDRRGPEYGDWLELSVRDSGAGIPREKLDEIWKPFYTTKESGRGTGLGLYSIRRTLSQAGGHIFVESGEGRGTVFTLYLPLRNGADFLCLPRSN
ncbi:MAG: PAS domain S-box protein [Spirochaetaceae bacterium]|jgi:two-component system cell cycle sensor histidine kinase/response regulator CckA|nr:PAS domain S-box protein [Spirochaetaceae bacterium]